MQKRRLPEVEWIFVLRSHRSTVPVFLTVVYVTRHASDEIISQFRHTSSHHIVNSPDSTDHTKPYSMGTEHGDRYHSYSNCLSGRETNKKKTIQNHKYNTEKVCTLGQRQSKVFYCKALHSISKLSQSL